MLHRMVDRAEDLRGRSPVSGKSRLRTPDRSMNWLSEYCTLNTGGRKATVRL